MIDRILSLVVAVSLAFLVWLYAASRDQEMLDNVPIPVRIVLGSGQAELYDLEVTGPSQVAVSFTGPPSRIREVRGLLQRGQMGIDLPLTVPAERQQEARYLDTVVIAARDIRTPPGIKTVVLEGRNRIPVTLRRIVERHLPVRLNHAADDRLAKVVLEPATVAVRGPQEVLDRMRAVSTEPFALPPVAEGAPGQQSVRNAVANLVGELEGRKVQVTPPFVSVQMTFKPRQKVYTLTDVPVHFLCPSNFVLRPKFVGDERSGKVALNLLGPAGEEAPLVGVFIDLTRKKFTPGLYADEPLQLQLPKEFQLAQPAPKSPSFQLQPLSPDATREPTTRAGSL